MEIVIHKDGSSSVPMAELKAVVKRVLEKYNAISNTAVKFTGGDVAPAYDAPNADGIMMIKFIKKGELWQWPAGQVVKVTSESRVDRRTGEMGDADILFNEWKFKFATANCSGTSTFDLEAVLTHAIGRLLGLGYSKEKNAVMFGEINACETGKRNLHQDDIKGIVDLYPLTPPCKEGEAVGSGYTCYAGRVSAVCAPYSEVCKACSGNEDCRGANNFCNYGQDGGRCGMDCSGTNSCPKGYRCAKVMSSDGQTQIGSNCVPADGKCSTAEPLPCCRTLEDCLPGFTCTNTQCVKGAVSDPCKGACKEGEECVNGQCEVKSCSNNDQCGVGFACVQSRCVKQGACAGGCADGQVCSNNTCKADLGSSCSGNTDCASGFCGTGAGLSLCTKGCVSASECNDGQFCVQNLQGDVTKGCWPAKRSTCVDGKCYAGSGGGCNCSSTSQLPVFEGAFLLLLLLLTRLTLRLRPN
jgi:hypothetical protein